jgi:TatD DNase family protein
VIKLFDAGVNLFSNQFDHDRAEVVKRARQQGVNRLLLISSDLAETKLNQQYSNTFPGLYCTAGVHPHQAINVSSDWQEQLSELLQQSQVVAVGECGLDFNRDFSPRQQQIAIFEQQLVLAKRCGKAVYLHERDAFDTQLALLQQHQIQRGVAHCFTGDQNQLKAYLDQGLYIGITGWLCDERRHQQLVQAIRYLPLDRLLLETDAPYLLPRTLQPKPKIRRNEPMYLTEVLHYLAQLVGKSAEEISAISWNNSCTLFNLPLQGRELDD